MPLQPSPWPRLLRAFVSLALLSFCTFGHTADLFPVIPPIKDANPSIRHPAAIEVPGVMKVARNGDSLTVSFPTFQKTNLMVGQNMVLGIMREDFVIVGGVPRLLGMTLGHLQPSTNNLTLGQNGLPPKGQEFILEYRVTVFETDLPAQHMWSPQSGKHYKVLWTRTFKEAIK